MLIYLTDRDEMKQLREEKLREEWYREVEVAWQTTERCWNELCDARKKYRVISKEFEDILIDIDKKRNAYRLSMRRYDELEQDIGTV